MRRPSLPIAMALAFSCALFWALNAAAIRRAVLFVAPFAAEGVEPEVAARVADRLLGAFHRSMGGAPFGHDAVRCSGDRCVHPALLWPAPLERGPHGQDIGGVPG
jgi:hypothetical protein